MPYLNLTNSGKTKYNYDWIEKSNQIFLSVLTNASAIILTFNCLVSMQRVLWTEMMEAVLFLSLPGNSPWSHQLD